jgi:hypothetical protein
MSVIDYNDTKQHVGKIAQQQHIAPIEAIPKLEKLN